MSWYRVWGGLGTKLFVLGGMFRPTKSIMYVPCPIARFQQFILLIVQFCTKKKIQKILFWIRCSGIWISAQDHAVWFIIRLIPVDFFISTKLGGLIPTGRFDTSQVPARGKSVGLALQYHYMIHRVGRVKDFITHLADISRKECDWRILWRYTNTPP